MMAHAQNFICSFNGQDLGIVGPISKWMSGTHMNVIMNQESSLDFCFLPFVSNQEYVNNRLGLGFGKRGSMAIPN